jgi:hypothetical protein
LNSTKSLISRGNKKRAPDFEIRTNNTLILFSIGTIHPYRVPDWRPTAADLFDSKKPIELQLYLMLECCFRSSVYAAYLVVKDEGFLSPAGRRRNKAHYS